MLTNYVCAVDIGNSKISAAVVVVKKKRVVDVFCDTVASQAVKNGAIVDSVALVSGVSSLLKNLKVKSGIAIKYIYVNLSGKEVITRHSRAILPLIERGNKVITNSDIQKVKEQAVILGSNLDEEIIHEIPYSYNIDSKSNCLNPLGLYSHKLEIDLYLICARLSALQSFTHAVNQAGYEIKDLFFSGLATSAAVFSPEDNHGMTVFCDVGSDITELLFFQDDALKIIEILPVGGNDFTLELARELKISFDFAEEIKITHGVIDERPETSQDKEILIKKDTVYNPIKLKMVTDCLTAKAKSFCQSLLGTIEKHMPCTGVDRVVVCGRAFQQEGLLEMLEKVLGVPTRLGRIVNPDLAAAIHKQGNLSGQKYLSYLAALGIICFTQRESKPLALPAIQPSRNPFLKTINKIKDIYQEYF
ncbi:MAG: cell division protein FtsA [Candidatus Omnitrophota bacterium]|jgi:cell division protein FtsA